MLDTFNPTTDIKQLLHSQKAFFDSGHTKDIAYRKAKLAALDRIFRENEERILTALKQDLSKSFHEGYMTEFGIILGEIRFAKKHLSKWARPRKVRTHLLQFPASSYIYPQPYGITLILAPWNYPFSLSMAPLIGSIAAGNCCVIKPSEYAPRTSKIVSEIIDRNFDPRYIAVIEGDAHTSSALLDEPFDYIFFTGSPAIGKIVMEAAAKHLTPLTLELGGKSPCIVDRGIDLDRTARRIVSGKFINAGQTCIAPDYLLVHHSIKAELLDRIGANIRRFYGDDPQQSPDYPRIIHDMHFNRLAQLLTNGSIVHGGQTDREDLYIAPTLLDNISWDDPVMRDEIFGPLLPVIGYDSLSEVISRVRELPRPLGLYFFSNKRQDTERIINEIAFGGGCINDTLLHYASPHLPFGGIGSSGIGSYHGKASFDAFSHQKSILKKSFSMDIPLRYPPFRNKLKLLKKLMH
jgi:aldehyde dehydrogenase (NAD+)